MFLVMALCFFVFLFAIMLDVFVYVCCSYLSYLFIYYYWRFLVCFIRSCCFLLCFAFALIVVHGCPCSFLFF